MSEKYHQKRTQLISRLCNREDKESQKNISHNIKNFCLKELKTTTETPSLKSKKSFHSIKTDKDSNTKLPKINQTNRLFLSSNDNNTLPIKNRVKSFNSLESKNRCITYNNNINNDNIINISQKKNVLKLKKIWSNENVIAVYSRNSNLINMKKSRKINQSEKKFIMNYNNNSNFMKPGISNKKFYNEKNINNLSNYIKGNINSEDYFIKQNIFKKAASNIDLPNKGKIEKTEFKQINNNKNNIRLSCNHNKIKNFNNNNFGLKSICNMKKSYEIIKNERIIGKNRKILDCKNNLNKNLNFHVRLKTFNSCKSNNLIEENNESKNEINELFINNNFNLYQRNCNIIGLKSNNNINNEIIIKDVDDSFTKEMNEILNEVDNTKK